MIKQLKEKGISISMACKTLEISSSGYYACDKNKRLSDRAIEDQEILLKMNEIHQKSRGTYGEPRLRVSLKSFGFSTGKKRIVRLMKTAGISGLNKKRFRVKTTDSKHNLPIAQRIIQTENKATLPKQPNEVWAGDITYIPTKEGWMYLSVYLDMFTRKIVGYEVEDNMCSDLVLRSLESAVMRQKPERKKKNLTVHSDRGSQYASKALRKRLHLLGITASMSRKGNCYDNAYAESFFHTLKTELVYRRKFNTKKEAKQSIFEYIETWYNQRRLHSSLGYMSPIDYEKLYEKNHVTA